MLRCQRVGGGAGSKHVFFISCYLSCYYIRKIIVGQVELIIEQDCLRVICHTLPWSLSVLRCSVWSIAPLYEQGIILHTMNELFDGSTRYFFIRIAIKNCFLEAFKEYLKRREADL